MEQGIGTLIVSTPGILSGRPRIDGTRIGVRTIATWYKKGFSAEEISEQVAQVSLAQIYAALAYYHTFREEVEADIAAEAALYDELSEAHADQEQA